LLNKIIASKTIGNTEEYYVSYLPVNEENTVLHPPTSDEISPRITDCTEDFSMQSF